MLGSEDEVGETIQMIQERFQLDYSPMIVSLQSDQIKVREYLREAEETENMAGNNPEHAGILFREIIERVKQEPFSHVILKSKLVLQLFKKEAEYAIRAERFQRAGDICAEALTFDWTNPVILRYQAECKDALGRKDNGQ